MTKPGLPLRFIQEVALLHEADECLKWPYSTNSAGYGKIRLNGKLQHVNRVVCEAVNGPPPTPEHEAAHSCGKGHEACIAPNHLSWKTPSANAFDKVTHGTDNRGERHPLAKLSEADVREILGLRGKLTHQKIADLYGVDRRHVGLILQRKTWRSLDMGTGAYEQKRGAAAA